MPTEWCALHIDICVIGIADMDINYELPDFYLTRLQERLHTWNAFETEIINKIPGLKEKLGK